MATPWARTCSSSGSASTWMSHTPAKVKDMPTPFRPGSGWSFITGKSEDISAIRHKLGDRGAKISDHRNETLTFNGATGDWERGGIRRHQHARHGCACHGSARRAEQGKDRRSHASQEPRCAARPNLPGQAMSPRPARPPHTGRGDRIGPDLVNSRPADRATGWPETADPESLRKGQDATALALAERYPTVPTPRLGSPRGRHRAIIQTSKQTFNVTASKPPEGHRH